MLFKLVSRTLVALATGLLLTHVALADEAQIRKNIAERFPDWPKIDELTKTPLAGIYELRIRRPEPERSGEASAQGLARA